MLMDNTLELLGITDSNIKITRFSAESVNGEKRNVIEARLTYNGPYCESEKVVRNGSKILHTRFTKLHQERFEMKLYKQRYLCKECLKTWSARTDIVEEGHTLSHQLKRSVLHMAREGITATGIARICHCSPSSVIRIIDEAVELKSRVARLPENLCFDEFRSVNSTMSFICCDAEGSHDIVAILENRLTKTIREHFMNRYTNWERAAVKSVVVDLNAQYIKALFPNARIIIDRFHIVQLVGRALGNARISLMKKMNDCHCREYKILKAYWRLFHKDSADLEAARSVYLRGVNEYMTQQNALDLIVKNHPQFEKVYDAYQDVFNALKEKNRERLTDVLENYRRSGQNMDTAISTLKKNMTAVLNSVEYDFSNGPVEGINRRIKSLKRSCFGFRNLDNFRKRIALIRS
jgi:transposase